MKEKLNFTDKADAKSSSVPPRWLVGQENDGDLFHFMGIADFTEQQM